MILIVFILSMLPILEMLLILSIIRYLTLFKSIFIGIRTFFFLNFSAIPTWQFLRCGQIVWTLTCLVLLFLLNEISMPEKSLRSTTLLPKLVSLSFGLALCMQFRHELKNNSSQFLLTENTDGEASAPTVQKEITVKNECRCGAANCRKIMFSLPESQVIAPFCKVEWIAILMCPTILACPSDLLWSILLSEVTFLIHFFLLNFFHGQLIS